MFVFVFVSLFALTSLLCWILLTLYCFATACYDRQRSGRGRGGNGWISPAGSMSVTMRLKYDPLPRYLVFIQYIAGLAVVEAVRNTPGFEDVPLAVKWPNDIYYCDRSSGDGKPDTVVKLGGVLVTCQSIGSVIDVMVGVGVNVCNPHPTVSLAQVASAWAAKHGRALEPLSVEYVLAKFVSQFERLLSDLTRGCVTMLLFCSCL